MKIELWLIGKNDNRIEPIIEQFKSRIKRYVSFEAKEISEGKKGRSSPRQIKESESKFIRDKLDAKDYLIILDEKGKQYSSVAFAKLINRLMTGSKQKVIFLIGGAYGFSDAIYQKADQTISLSTMTLSHQIVRPVFLEQLYRAFTIINNEPYHHS